jgi:hypothetical protein
LQKRAGNRDARARGVWGTMIFLVSVEPQG